MTAVVIVGAQWGDEGKGKLVDLYAERADLVVRFAGGPNAGHTLVVGEERFVLRLIPSGILHTGARCLMGQGMVVDAAVLVGEIDALEARGHRVSDRLLVSERAHLILPHHPVLDGLRESNAATERKIGTTKRGIGPCYEDKAARRGARVGDLRDLPRLEAIIERQLAAWAPVAAGLGGALPAVREIMAALEPLAARLLPLLADVPLLVDEALRAGKRVLIEGAQGTLLDLDHGTYPFVTSSSAVAGGACVGAGVGPTRIDRVVGITKAYSTRVGEGPFPTELSDAVGERLRVAGGEFGSVTGRPRRTGWLDLCALRFAARVNGLDGLAVTKLDVLTGLPEVCLCVAYDTPEGRTTELPVDALETARPVYETLPGWTTPIEGVSSREQLPAQARSLLDRIEDGAGVGVDVISVGARRDQTIVLKEPFG